MRVAPLVLLLPFVAAQGVRKLKLQKLPAALGNQELETAYLAEKYGGVVEASTETDVWAFGMTVSVYPCLCSIHYLLNPFIGSPY